MSFYHSVQMSIPSINVPIDLACEISYTLYVSFHFVDWWGNPGDRVRFSFLGGAATPIEGLTRLVEET